MFVVSHAGYLYGPFENANGAAGFAEAAKLQGPWHIVKLSMLTLSSERPLTPDEVAALKIEWEKHTSGR